MGLFDWFLQKFSKKKVSGTREQSSFSEEKSTTKNEDDWEDLPAYIDVDLKEHELVSVVASSIAAGEYPESKFVIKKIQKRNPEVKKVSIISTALATGVYPESKFIIKKIQKKKRKEEDL